MKIKKSTLRQVKVYLVSITLCIVLLLTGIKANNFLASLKQEPKKVDRIQTFTTVKTQKVFRKEYQDKIRGYGTVEPILDTTISSEVSGAITWISPRLRRGEVFNDSNKPQKLLQIDDYVLQEQKASAISNLQKAKAAVEAVEIEITGTSNLLKNAKKERQTSQRELTRSRKLIQERGISPSDLDRQIMRTTQTEKEVLRLTWQYESQKNNRKQVQADLALAKARLTKIENDLRRTTIYTPYAGYITEVNVNYGTYVTPGMPLLRIVNTEKVAVAISVAASRYGQIQMAAPADIVINNKRQWQGKVVRILPDVDPQTRTFQVFVEIDYRQNIIPTGIFAICEVQGRVFKDVFVIPRTAIIDDFVFVARRLPQDKNKATVEKRLLTIKAYTSEYALVSAGLQDEDEVIITNVEEISEGSYISIFSGYQTSKQR